MRTRVADLCGLYLLLAATAQAKEVDETIDAAAKGHVDISNIAGSIDVEGWSRNSVHVEGTLGENVEELVLERDPYTLPPGADLPVRVSFEGKPLVGGTVKLNNLDFDERPLATHVSDATGRALFRVPRIGNWQLNVIWTKPIKGNPKADFETTFSSLTFGYPRPPMSRRAP